MAQWLRSAFGWGCDPGSWDQVLHQVPHREPAPPSASVSAPLSVCLPWINKILKERKEKRKKSRSQGQYKILLYWGRQSRADKTPNIPQDCRILESLKGIPERSRSCYNKSYLSLFKNSPSSSLLVLSKTQRLQNYHLESQTLWKRWSVFKWLSLFQDTRRSSAYNGRGYVLESLQVMPTLPWIHEVQFLKYWRR